MNNIPGYLEDFIVGKDMDLRSANKAWLKEARYGMFIHYGLYSMLGRGEWVQYNECIPVSEYEKLKDCFTAENFDAQAIADYAKNCGMKYITFTTKHHDAFCLWDTKTDDFNSMNSKAKRDFVKEMLFACEKNKLALFLYYTHGRDWRYPHAPNNDEFGGKARPEYDPLEPSYIYGRNHDLEKYNQLVLSQISELIQKYPSAAGIWLDGIAVPLSGDYSRFKLQRLYDRIHELSPHMLVSYKQGVLGTEDYFAPEHIVPTKSSAMGTLAQNGTQGRLIEVCTNMLENPGSWGWNSSSTHKSLEQVLDTACKTFLSGANLLINSGPLGDGSIDEIDRAVLIQAAEEIEKMI